MQEYYRTIDPFSDRSIILIIPHIYNRGENYWLEKAKELFINDYHNEPDEVSIISVDEDNYTHILASAA